MLSLVVRLPAAGRAVETGRWAWGMRRGGRAAVPSPPGDYLDRLTAAAKLRRDAARAVASAVARVTACASFMVRPAPSAHCARRKGTPAACAGCRCSEAPVGAPVSLGQSTGRSSCGFHLVSISGHRCWVMVDARKSGAGKRHPQRGAATPVRVTRVDPDALALAVELAEGDIRRVRVVDARTVLVRNQAGGGRT